MKAEKALVRILEKHTDAERIPSGGGVLISPGHVLTCGHVVRDALNDGVVRFDFSHIADCPVFKAEVCHEDQDSDITLLYIVKGQNIPEEAKPAPFVKPETVHDGREAYICGFPEFREKGDWAYGRLIGETGEGWIQFDHDLTSKMVKPGFSGAPVWNDGKTGVVGMTVQRFTTETECSAYLIPVRKLEAACRAAGASLSYQVAAPPSARTVFLNETDRDMIYYRINRTEQITGLKEFVVEKGDAPFWCILHGSVDECHESFMMWLRDYYWEKRIAASPSAPKLIQLKWPAPNGKKEGFEARVMADLARAASLPEEHCSPEAFNKKTSHHPVLVYSQLRSNALDEPDARKKLIEGFSGFWNNWPQRIRRDAPLVACLEVIYWPSFREESFLEKFKRFMKRRPDKAAINRGVRNTLKQAYTEYELRELEPVGLDDVLDWAVEPDVQVLTKGSGRPEISRIFEEAGADRIPMRNLAKALADRFSGSAG